MGISFGGLVSGMDSASIITQLMALERKPLTLLQNKRDNITAEKLAWQDVSSKMMELKTAANSLATAGSFASRSATFTPGNAVSASAITVSAASNATNGKYSISVTNLARAQKSALDQNFADSNAAMGLSGTLTVATKSISVTSTTTLAGLKDLVNNSGAGVTADIFNAGTTASPQYRLMLSGSNTGAANSFAASFSNPSMTFTTTQAAADANLLFDNVAITKSSNSISDIITGATINLQSAGSGTITMSTDQAGIVSKVQTFVDKYNALMDYMKQQLAYDSANKTKGTLFGNATLMTMQNQFRSIVTGTVPGLNPADPNILTSLSQVGIKNDVNNTMTLDTSVFNTALTNKFDQVSRLFASGGSGTYSFVSATGFTQGGTYDTQVVGGVLQMRLAGSTGSWTSLTQDGNFAFGQANTPLDGLLLRTGSLTNGQTGTMTITAGVGTRVQGYSSRYTEYSTAGLIFNQNKSLETRDKSFQDQMTDLTTRLTEKEKNLREKFTKLETLLSKMSSQQAYLSQQLSGVQSGTKKFI